jgi:hypothetical protein
MEEEERTPCFLLARKAAGTGKEQELLLSLCVLWSVNKLTRQASLLCCCL